MQDCGTHRLSPANVLFLLCYVEGRTGYLASLIHVDEATILRWAKGAGGDYRKVADLAERLHERGDTRLADSLSPRGCTLICTSGGVGNDTPDDNVADRGDNSSLYRSAMHASDLAGVDRAIDRMRREVADAIADRNRLARRLGEPII